MIFKNEIVNNKMLIAADLEEDIELIISALIEKQSDIL